jgi:hypothetical protein
MPLVVFVDETAQISELYDIPTPLPSPYQQGLQGTRIPGTPIHDETDAFYMCRYTEIIGPRFDMFDEGTRYFSTVVPLLALSNRIVLLSCLAVAARHYSLVGDHGHEHALAYYNEAIRLLYEHLNHGGHNAAVFASCLLIAHCEMVESKASDWNLHLRGTGDLIAVQKWHGESGGLAQAVRAGKAIS